MVRLSNERVLLIGDAQREIQAPLAAALPAAQVTLVPNVFEAIAELAANSYTAVIAAAEPIERRPEAAVRTLRELTGDGRLILFGHPTLEPLSRKMLEFGCDDYIITPANPGELQQMFGTPLPRAVSDAPTEGTAEPLVTEAPTSVAILHGIPLADVVLDAMTNHPSDAPASVVKQINGMIGPTMQLLYVKRGAEVPPATEGLSVVPHPVRSSGEDAGQLCLVLPASEEVNASRHFLAGLSQMLGKVIGLQERHNRLQKLAITDQLTSVYNRRYFEHFLKLILERAKVMRFPVTLLLFDIDNFKKYNDKYGHGVGDEILRETASVMKKCCRDHDLVARIGGDEFAVIFWEKDGPRQPKDPRPAMPARPPQTPIQIFERFQRLIGSQDFPGLGQQGQGVLTISGGLASYPWDGRGVQELIEAADKALTLGAKAAGKNCIFLVGEGDGGQSPG